MAENGTDAGRHKKASSKSVLLSSLSSPSGAAKITQGSNESEGSFINENGFKIFCKYWSKQQKSPRALLFICHGAGEHCLPYSELAQVLNDKGFYVFAHDHQGHGQSGGDRVHITEFRHYVRDVFAHIDAVKEEFPGLPIFIVGHSMGGAIAILSGIDRPELFKGVVLISPVVTADQETVGPVRIFFGKLMARIIPQFPVLKLDDADISRDKAECQIYKDDPLCYHGSLKAKHSLCLLNALMEIDSKLETIKWPFLVLHGGADAIINSNGSEALHKRAQSNDKTIKIFPPCYHQLHKELEPEKSEVFKDVVDWLVKRAP